MNCVRQSFKLVVKNGMTLVERATLAVLSTEPNINSFHQ